MKTEVIIGLVVVAAVLVAAATAVVRRIRAWRQRVSCEQLRLSYPELDRELDVIWKCLNPTSGS